MRESLGQEPLWNAGRRARPAGRALHLQVRWLVEIAPFGVLLPFFPFVRSCAAPDRDRFGFPLSERSDEGRECGGVLGNDVLITRVRIKKRAARTRTYFLSSPWRAPGGLCGRTVRRPGYLLAGPMPL